MRRFVVLSTAALAIVLTIIAMSGCGLSKPNGSEYLGTWDGAVPTNWTGSACTCPIEISKVGENFVVKSQNACAVCTENDGIYTVTPEGSLKGGPGGASVILFDKAKNQTVLSFSGKLWPVTKRQ